jgi:hypothetical protein
MGTDEVTARLFLLVPGEQIQRQWAGLPAPHEQNGLAALSLIAPCRTVRPSASCLGMGHQQLRVTREVPRKALSGVAAEALLRNTRFVQQG